MLQLVLVRIVASKNARSLNHQVFLSDIIINQLRLMVINRI